MSDLHELEARAAVLDEQDAPQPTANGTAVEAAPPVADDVRIAAELTMLLTVAVGVAGSLYPKIPGIWTEPVIRAVSQAAADVAVKHGFSPGFLSRWDAEIGLACVLVPLIGPTVQAMRFERAPKPDEKAVAAQAPAPVPGDPSASEDDVLSRSFSVTV